VPRTVLLVVAIGLLLAAGTARSALRCDPDVAGAAYVRAVAEGIVAADNARDLERVLGYYAPRATLMPPGEPPVTGHEAIRPRYEQLFRSFDPQIPFSERTRDAFWLSAGGSIEAGRRALADGYAQSIGGGFHHAFPDHGEGFCMIHDVAIAIRRLQADGAIATAMVVDTDVHQGNGTAAIFGGDASVFTLSIHQENNYPYPKPPSTVDIGLADGTRDDEYLTLLEESLVGAFRDFRADILFYVGGADPYREDQLGGIALTIDGLRQRDALVFDEAGRRGVPIASMLAGGYAQRVEDTVRIHVNTVLAARDRFSS
jgi:acetoin utilization deacetylase AcuC-like enzyme